MRIISIDSVRISNFKCFRDIVDVPLSDADGFIFMSGVNRVEPRLGSNGAGKSSLWDAICFCFYGSSVRGHHGSQLGSWETDKRPHVEITLDIDQSTYTVARTGKPDRLLVNGNPATQDELDKLLGMPRDCFLQSVIFGQANRLFVDLSIPERGALLDSVLDLELWTNASDHAAGQSKRVQAELQDAVKRDAFLRGQLDGLPVERELREQQAKWNELHDADVERAIADLEVAETWLDKFIQERDQLIVPDNPREELAEAEDNANQAYKELIYAQKRLADGKKMSRFFAEHSVCPTCSQKMEPVFLDMKLYTLKCECRDAAAECADAETYHDKMKHRVDRLRETSLAYQRTLEARKTAIRNIEDQQRRVDELEQRAREVAARDTNPFEVLIVAADASREEINAKIDKCRELQEALQADINDLDYWRQAFRRVRLFLVKRILAMLEIETANAANALGIGDWRITYDIEAETKSGNVKSGIYINIQAPNHQGSYTLYSPGESQRIKLAVTTGLAAMIQNFAGVYYSIEVWDEPTAWLSQEGVDDLLEFLNARVESTGKSIWLTDHQSLSYGGFDQVWQAEKTTLGTQFRVI